MALQEAVCALIAHHRVDVVVGTLPANQEGIVHSRWGSTKHWRRKKRHRTGRNIDQMLHFALFFIFSSRLNEGTPNGSYLSPWFLDSDFFLTVFHSKTSHTTYIKKRFQSAGRHVCRSFFEWVTEWAGSCQRNAAFQTCDESWLKQKNAGMNIGLTTLRETLKELHTSPPLSCQRVPAASQVESAGEPVQRVLTRQTWSRSPASSCCLSTWLLHVDTSVNAPIAIP